MLRLTEIITDPRKAAVIGAATGTVKGLLVGVVTGKLLMFAVLGAAGGAVFGAGASWVSRKHLASAVRVP